MSYFEEFSVGTLTVDRVLGPGAVGVPVRGTKFFLDPANGSDGNDGKSPLRAFKTLPVAYAALTANQHDTLFYLAGSSSISLAAAFTWAKNYTHFIGVAAPVATASRARIFAAAGSTFTPMITISATGCRFENLYMFHGVDAAAALVDVKVTGGRNHFYRCHFAGIGHATQAGQAARSLWLSAAEENLFEECTIGVDTVPREATCTELLCDTAATRNVFKKCTFRATVKAGGGAATFLTIGSGGIDRDLTFEDCLFLNAVGIGGATVMTQAFSVHASAGGTVILAGKTGFLGCTDWSTASVGIYGVGFGTITGNTFGQAVQVAAGA